MQNRSSLLQLYQFPQKIYVSDAHSFLTLSLTGNPACNRGELNTNSLYPLKQLPLTSILKTH